MNPYKSLPDHAYWRRSVAQLDEVDPVVRVPFILSSEDKVVTAGSCFAQHISRYLCRSGFNYYVTETPHPLSHPDDAAEFGYGVFTARYGNIYTARQLLQLLHRSYGIFQPREDVWEDVNSFKDPFRPQIQPGGFLSRREYDLAREAHFASVRDAAENLDVLVFTLGLTEGWRSREDGAMFPVCPGVSGGEFDEARHEFKNFTASEVEADLIEAVKFLRKKNVNARIILTVSPVPLVATAGGDHVLTATVYSKSVLRVAAEAVSRALPDVAYFPSYEIIVGPASRGRYFAEDLRSIREEGVAHVIRVFMRHFATITLQSQISPLEQPPTIQTAIEQMEELVRVSCEEESLDRA